MSSKNGKNGKKAREKAGEKAGERSEGSDLVPQDHGGAIYQGAPANPVAGTGRPPNEFRRKMRDLVGREETEAYLEECLKGEHGARAFQRALEYATEYGYGKAPATVKVEDDRSDERGYDSARIWEMVEQLQDIRELEKMLAEGRSEDSETGPKKRF